MDLLSSKFSYFVKRVQFGPSRFHCLGQSVSPTIPCSTNRNLFCRLRGRYVLDRCIGRRDSSKMQERAGYRKLFRVLVVVIDNKRHMPKDKPKSNGARSL